MATHAVVIGIGAYRKLGRPLKGAVRDAFDFARWLLKPDGGAVAPENLTFLADPPRSGLPAGVRVAEPSRENILDALEGYEVVDPAQVDRLYVFYAGHGVAPPGAGKEAPPILLPASFAANQDPEDRGVNLGGALDKLRTQGPALQFVFVDACRDVFKPAKPVGTLRVSVYSDEAVLADKVTQCWLFATRAGRWANELGGRGVFTRALLEGLEGRGPILRRRPLDGYSRLTFRELGRYVKARVDERLKLGVADPRQILSQQATFQAFPGDRDAVDARPPLEPPGPRLRVRVVVDPPEARASARIQRLEYNEAEGRAKEVESWPVCDLPVVDLSLPASETVALRASAKGFTESAPVEVPIWRDTSLLFRLDPQSAPASNQGFLNYGKPLQPNYGGLRFGRPTRIGLVRPLVPRLQGGRVIGGLRPPKRPAPPARSLSVRCGDARAHLTVLGAFQRPLADGFVQVGPLRVPPGRYLVRAQTPGVPDIEAQVDVAADDVDYEVRPPAFADRSLADAIAHALDPAGGPPSQGPTWIVEERLVWPSEHLGAVADLRLGSVLAWAAWAARWEDRGDFQKLRAVGVPRVQAAEGRCPVMVLVGDALREAYEGPAARVVLGALGREHILDVTPLARLPRAAVAHGEAEPGPLLLRVELEGAVPTTFAGVALAGFVTLLVVATESWGETEVTQYLLPADPDGGLVGLAPSAPGDIRTHELGVRALEERLPVRAGEYRPVVDHGRPAQDRPDPVETGAWSNPLAAVVAGYRLKHEGRAAPVRRLVDSLVSVFPGLPDLHVLAAWADPDHRATHLERAAAAGLPLLAEGHRELLHGLPGRALGPPGAGSPLPAALWTSFAHLPRAVPVLRGNVAAGLNAAGSAVHDRVSAVLPAIARLGRRDDPATPFVGSAFLLAPGTLVTARYVGRALLSGEMDPSSPAAWPPPAPIVADFRARGGPAAPAEVSGLVGEADAGGMGGIPLGVVVLRLPVEDHVAPVRVRTRPPIAGEAVAVIGYPAVDPRVPRAESDKAYGAFLLGETFVIPGKVLAVSPDGATFTHDCFTLAGTGGALVLDLETGEAVGVHQAGRWDGERKVGTASALAPLLATALFQTVPLTP